METKYILYALMQAGRHYIHYIFFLFVQLVLRLKADKMCSF